MNQVLTADAVPASPAPAMQPQIDPAAALAKDAKVRDLMSPPVGVYRGSMTVAETTEALREATRKAFITYVYIADEDNKLEGLVVMRDMLLAKPDDKLSDIMLKEPFALKADVPLEDALKEALGRHYPVYPVVDDAGVLAGLVRGETLFANRAIAISGQSGSMVGVDNEERLSTPLKRSLLLRHPWLQINLLTAFVAAAVVGLFEHTLAELVILAVFLPVMAGQTGNTGCQALAVALRGMTLGDLKPGSERSLVIKEGSLGFFNGLLVGITAGIGMIVYATMTGEAQPIVLGLVVFMSMITACTVAGISGAMIPLILKKLGADPATASSIFLTTMSDVASMGIFLSLATALLM
ncbi:MAG TPA: magnesium transporter [Croceibacterium sp.]